MNLNKAEEKANNFLLNIILKGNSKPCDEYLNHQSFSLPLWYDEQKFKRGQKYCLENRSGILLSSFYGGISVICDSKTASVLIRGKSKDKKLAKTRGISTGLSVFLWFKDEIKPGSRSFESLKRIRKIHLNASRAADGNKIGFITQYDMLLQHFAAMGYALIKPQFFGISYDCNEDREAYLHFYAVIGNLLGIKDEFNLCLHELEVVEM
ncbi:hypothetical protein PVAND_016921 [Polypedilum vanderplanki]|uniref:DUF2236 domain-containing protein n=1 Tax=Polypedilum vanderplanki TaxID=319348 RepID=A0A9J6BHL6_POLVA|nr:hypothetical protein PVAND_016921 [Polypedilum vanderplanki]